MNNKIVIALTATLLYFLPLKAQKGVLWDKTNNMPIAHASIYANNQGRVSATSTDVNGHFEITFPFNTLTVSHISYKKLNIAVVKDTIFLTPKIQMLSEITVVNTEPTWIKEKLHYFIKNRKRLYQTDDKQMEYDYGKCNISDTCGYTFHSHGLMYVPSMTNLNKDSMYQVCPTKNIVQYKDSTAGVDFYDLQLMMYENIVSEMNSKFIKRHVFRQNEAYQNPDKSIQQIVFWSEKYKDDKGTITIDTARCVILEANRSTGLACNLDEKMNSFVLSSLHTAIGLQYKDWTIDNTIHFKMIDGIYYPSYITYKYYESYTHYDKLATSKKKKSVDCFSDHEASVSLHEALFTSTAHYYDIPHDPHSAIIYIESKRHSLNNIAIKKMPREYKQL